MGNGGEKAMARITYYGHGNRETGAERPDKGLKVSVKMDVIVTSGPGNGATSSFKAKKVPGDLAWLLQEGMEVPVFTNESGKATGLDIDGLAPLLESGADDLDAARKDQSSLGYQFRLRG